MDLGALERNLRTVTGRIAAACERAGREPEAVRLVAVTKTVGPEVIRALVGLGALDIGENRVQEVLRKQNELRDAGVRWHMVGHLQTNKVKEALRLFHLIHSVDSVHLAEALDRRAGFEGRTVPVLVQVSVSGEETKSGVPAASAAAEVKRMAEFESLRVMGLMTMAPFVDDAEKVRWVFRRLRELAGEIEQLNLPRVRMAELSMGMTQDYEVAVEEGATFVRVGTALFAGVC